ncbi:hypothetical protein FHX52_3041 [Humibacillus xanthopallidus]|uniref:Uncharacterized protein n=1 Tax=Humibacillus xanthopallidus TaxID=412689 RepID=A0A543PQG7_9MICO|nr:hypothetical protein [Humibacillus xanthopallidus]TQN46321.1 hypothetical protein FHX52_3041 [Humibacillus xanthopallidus]
MTDDPTRLPASGPNQPEDGGDRLRKVLGAVDDLEPPRDDLFAQRALLRGRARTSRRRNGLLGAAAAVVVVGAVGGAWVVGQQGAGSSTSAGSAMEERAVSDAAGADKGAATGGDTGAGLLPTSLPTGIPTAPSLPSAPGGVSGAQDGSAWFTGPTTPQRTAFETVEPRLVTEFADVFAGAYAAGDGTDRIVVTVTRTDPALEALVTDAMPSPGDVEFRTVTHSYAAKRAVLDQIVADAPQWRAQGVDITGVRIDGRSDRVVVAAVEGLDPGVLARHYGPDLVSVEVAADTGKLPDGTLSTPQR